MVVPVRIGMLGSGFIADHDLAMPEAARRIVSGMIIVLVAAAYTRVTSES